MASIVNPYIAGSPVTGYEMFFDREDVFDFIGRALIGQHRDNVIILYGQRRTGKTSVLYQLPSHLDARYLCIFIDLHGLALEGLGGFLWELANHIVRVLRRDYQIYLPRPNRVEFMIDPRGFFENEFLNQVWSAAGDRHVLLMLDEAVRLEEQVRAGKLEHEIFEYMRHLMQHHERLNFLFSLGSGLEEMEKEYAFLFNVGLYKKISFLDRNAIHDLITQPVKDYYQVEQAAVERIYHITSGHPYYTQLLCHCLFNCWQQQRMSHINVRDVDEILNEAVERGSAVLKHVWEESTAGEKAIMAGMVTAMGTHNCPVGIKTISRVWTRCNIVMPEDERAKAIKGLIARDIIVGQDKYMFTVDLQRLWVQKHRRLEWVKEEIADAIREWSSNVTTSKQDLYNAPLQVPLSFPPRRFSVRRLTALALLILAFLMIVGDVSLYWETTNQEHEAATATAQTNATSTAQIKATANAQATATFVASHYPFSNNLVLEDPLSDNSKGNNWDVNTSSDGKLICQFIGGAYHAVALDPQYRKDCFAKNTTFSNFAYQVEMAIVKGDAGGIIFRTIQGSGYFVFISTQGDYELDSYDGQNYKTLVSGTSAAIKPGLNQFNLVAVVARGNTLELYVNKQLVVRVIDNTYDRGQIGVTASSYGNPGHPTEVVYSNAKVWKL